MAELPPIVQEFRGDSSHFCDMLDIIVRHLSALRDELRAHNGAPPPPPRVTVVVAGNWRQFSDWCREAGVSPHSRSVVYATATSLRGRRNVDVIRTGTWEERPDLQEIERDLRFANLANGTP
jgi:hypothetical protein